MCSLVVVLPLVGSLFSGFGGRYFGGRGSGMLATLFLFLTFFLSTFIFYDAGIMGNTNIITLYSWVDSELFYASFGFLFDPLTSVMLIVVSSVSALVHLYSLEYMSHDPHLPRFMSYLSLFTFFMLVLVTATNMLQMFVGWEGVGLCSYLLINFWHTRIQANKAAIKAMIMNRIGDFALALAIFLAIVLFKTLDYMPVFSLAPIVQELSINFIGIEFRALDVLCFLLFIGAVGKSAQLGLHTWLPDAMEGPTPVSALIHAATMVTAGVFLIARCSPLFEYAPNVLTFVTVIGGVTAFFAATIGLAQNDLKKVIAYSTCSQLGYMIFSCGVSSYAVAVFHLANHAFFKALLFLGAGSVIHGVADEQDMRKMGGLRKLLPFTYAMILIGSLSLMGFPFLTGFYSKDVVLEVAFAQYNTYSQFAFWLGVLAAFCTAFYSARLLFLTFLSEPSGSRPVIQNAQEPGWKMLAPLGLLALPSIFIGYLWKDVFIGLGTDFWGLSLFHEPFAYQLIDAEFLDLSHKLAPTLFSLLGAGVSFTLFCFNKQLIYRLKFTKIGKIVYMFLNRKWYLDRFYTEFITQNLLKFGFTFTYKAVDRGIVETFGPFGTSKFLQSTSKAILTTQSGFLYHYTFYMFTGFTLLLFIVTVFSNYVPTALILIFLAIYFIFFGL